MNFTSVQQTVSQIWEFIFPPVFTVFLLFLVAYLIIGDPLFIPFSKLASYGVDLLQNETTKKLIEFYGISSLMPIIALFTVISLLYVSMVAVRVVASALPVSPTYDPDLLFLTIDNSDRLARIWSKFPNVGTFGNLRTIIQERPYKADKELDKPFLGIQSWESTASSRMISFITTKFLILWAVLCLLASVLIGNSFFSAFVRTLPILAVLAVAAIYFMVHFYYATEQLAHSQLNAVDALVTSNPNGAGANSEATLKSFRDLVAEEKNKWLHRKWWEVRIFNKYFYEWAYQTFVVKRRAL